MISLLLNFFKEFKNKLGYFLISLLFILFSCCIYCSDSDNAEPVYHTPENLINYLQQVNKNNPSITYLDQAGISENGRSIPAFCISDNPNETESEPKIRLTGAIHGDENATAEVLVRLIDYIINKYKNGDVYIKSLVDNRYIAVIPMMNPDGVVLNTRENANGVDLNRNFEEQWVPGYDHGTGPFSEPESQSIRDYSTFMMFQSSLTFHTGAVILNMPFDYVSEHADNIVPAENALVKYLALQYTESGRFLESPGILNVPYVDRGTINGGDWYRINGSLQDWSYIKSGCIDMTVEISNSRPQTKEDLDELFDLNRDSILAFIEASGIGVYGSVTNSSNQPVAAEITVAGGDIIIHSDSFGYYHRILQAGTYDITFAAFGYQTKTVPIIIPAENPFLLNVTMTP